MILLVILASILIVVITFFQYKEQTQAYNKERFDRKEQRVNALVNYWLNSTQNTFPIHQEYLAAIFRDKIYEISNTEELEMNIYNLKGKLQKSSHSGFIKNEIPQMLSDTVLFNVANNSKHKYTTTKKMKGSTYLWSYSYINNPKLKPIGILSLHYVEDNTKQESDLSDFLLRLAYVYILILLIAISLALLLSSYISSSIEAITNSMKKTAFNKSNEKIIMKNEGAEIQTLISAYNQMVDKLEDSAVKLAKSERKTAWKSMAKQVAHEIKNPLTPMKLTVQSFQMKFDPTDPNIKEKVNKFSDVMIQQIDTLNSIASAFSSFAKMPMQSPEFLNVVEVVKKSLDVFPIDYIKFSSQKTQINVLFDKSQLVRILTNLIKNAMQALDEIKHKKIVVIVLEKKENVQIIVADNGKGISEKDKKRIFEPKFTTKNSGMGLGLAMVKEIIETSGGSINFDSEIGKGTTFKIVLKKESSPDGVKNVFNS
jgi:nitrogen fixation/metabolism regulation signal transduction histidine kinase